MSSQAARALLAVIDTIIELVRAAPTGIPAGELYAVLMGFCTLAQFEELMGLIVASGRIVKEGFIYRVPS
jgi:hypothetical protein